MPFPASVATVTTVNEDLRVGPLVREWRRRRRRSQMDLALDCGISTRHLSFVETGRSRPSAPMVLRLAEELEVPLRDRNALLLAAGHAPAFGQRAFEDPEMAAVREAIDRVLDAHEPFPAVVIDRGWNSVAANSSLLRLVSGAAPRLLEAPVNIVRLTLHPDGLAPTIANLAEWRAHLLDRLARQVALTGDAELAALLEEVRGYPGPPLSDSSVAPPAHAVAVPLRLRTPGGETLSFLSTMATFGTSVDITVSELSIESFFPADAATATALR